MNDYNLYESLRTAERIAAKYPEGAAERDTLHRIAEEISSQVYRVAVIGEFKRGKSSLVNALLGVEILPTDVLPATAAVTRIIYGTESRITVRFRDGHSEVRTIEELNAYSTKYTAENSKIASEVEEVVVEYPSVFCRNHLELLDTPGLNDDESMTERTMRAVGYADAALMVISFEAPLSRTEQKLVEALIARQEIMHVFFAVTMFDRIRREQDKERILSLIRERLSQTVLPSILEHSADTPKLQEKAKRILSEPLVFGVSALQAMTAFQKDDDELLDQSRFPYFKQTLLTLMTAAQQSDLPKKTLRAIQSAAEKLPLWQQNELQSLARQQTQQRSFYQARANYHEQAMRRTTQFLVQMDRALTKQGLDLNAAPCANFKQEMRRLFIHRLASVTSATNHHAHIYQLLSEAKADAQAKMEKQSAAWKALALSEQARVEEAFAAMRAEAMLEPAAPASRPFSDFPALAWTQSPIPEIEDLTQCNPMPTINAALNASFDAYTAAVSAWLAALRKKLFTAIKADRALPLPPSDDPDIAERLAALPYLHRQTQEELRGICKSLEAVIADAKAPAL
jgi:ribosome biogenesis GTPase A